MLLITIFRFMWAICSSCRPATLRSLIHHSADSTHRGHAASRYPRCLYTSCRQASERCRSRAFCRWGTRPRKSCRQPNWWPRSRSSCSRATPPRSAWCCSRRRHLIRSTVTFAVNLVLQKLPFVIALVRENQLALPVLAPVLVLALVDFPIWPLFLPNSVLLVFSPLPLVARPVFMCVHSTPARLIV